MGNRYNPYFTEKAIDPLTPQIADFRKLIQENTTGMKSSTKI